MENREGVFEILKEALTGVGFMAAEDFSAVDSLIHKEKYIGFFGESNCDVVGECIGLADEKYYCETELEIQVRLMGKSGDFTDAEEFDRMCKNLFAFLAADGRIVISSMVMGKMHQSMPLKRLQKDLKIKVRNLYREVDPV